MKSGTVGTISAVVGAVSYGTNPLWAHYLSADGISTHSMLFWRFALASIVLGLWGVARRIPLRARPRDLGTLAALGLLFAASAISLFRSFLHMDSGLACTLLFVHPVMVALLMAAIAHERAGCGIWLSMACALAGVALLTKPGGGASFSWTGFWLVMLSAATYAAYIVIVRMSHAGRMPAVSISFWSFAFCTVAVSVLGVAAGEAPLPPPTMRDALLLLGLALLPGLCSLVTMAVAIAKIGPTPTALLGSMEPVTAVLIGATLFGEPFSLRYAAGMGLVMAAVAAVVATNGRAGSHCARMDGALEAPASAVK